VLSGLAVNSYKFASVGPRFIVNDNTDLLIQIRLGVQLCFMRCPRNFDSILTHGLASLICHRAILEQILPADHRFRSTAFFRNEFSSIQSVAKYGLPWSDGFRYIAVTGLPPHVMLLSQMEELQGTYQRVSDGMLSRIVAELDNRTMGGVMSESRFRDLINEALQGVREEVSQIRGAQEEPCERGEEENYAQFRSQVYFTAGKWRRVPEGWQFPSVPCAAMWLSWMCPDVTRKISPMRLLILLM